MAISHYNSALNALDWVSGGVKSWSVDCGSGTDRFLLALVYTDRNMADGIITNLTYNGTAMTAATAAFYDGFTGYEIKLYYLANPSSGTNTLTASVGSDSTKVACLTSVYTGVKQDVGPNNPTTRGASLSNGATASFSQTTNSGETAVWMHTTFDAGGINKYTPGTGWTERIDNYVFVEDKDAGAGSTTIEWTNNSGTLISYNGVGMGLIAAGAAAGIPKTTRQTLLGIG